MNAIPFTWHLLHPRYWPVWLVIVPLLYLFSLLPWSIQRRLGTGLGLFIYSVIGQRKRDTLTNIRLCFPQKSPQDHEAMAKDVFVQRRFVWG